MTGREISEVPRGLANVVTVPSPILPVALGLNYSHCVTPQLHQKMPLQYQQKARLLHSEGHSHGVTTATFSPNGSLLASGGMDGRVCIWSLCTNKLRYVFSGKSPVLSLCWLESSNEELVCGMEDGTIASLRISTV